MRGDDVSFSLAHDFRIATLNGVVAFQDDDFHTKESLQTVYLDLRSHMVHHLALPEMERGALGACRIPAWFFLRHVVLMHYDTLEAMNLAVEDVMQGPEFFARNADMAARRADLKALTRAEAWQAGAPEPQPRVTLDPERFETRELMKYTLNGHLLPGFSRFGARAVLPAGVRGHLQPAWGAAEITYSDPEGDRHFTVRHSKTRAWRQGLRMLRNLRRLYRNYRRLRDDWRAGYEQLASETFWTGALELDEDTGQKSGREAAPEREEQTAKVG